MGTVKRGDRQRSISLLLLLWLSLCCAEAPPWPEDPRALGLAAVVAGLRHGADTSPLIAASDLTRQPTPDAGRQRCWKVARPGEWCTTLMVLLLLLLLLLLFFIVVFDL